MKNILLYLFCGAILISVAQSANAKVCFATDPDCKAGDEIYENFPDSNLNDQICQSKGYEKDIECEKDWFRYPCPNKRSYIKCCPPKYRYDSCIFPLEVDGNCGSKFSCKCPEDYVISSEFATKNNCEPGGGYCVLNDGTNDIVKYKTCSCNKTIYTDSDRCKNNQKEFASCTDDKGETFKKCFCDRNQYPYAECLYGKVSGSTTCIDSNSNREYYQFCRSPEEACKDDGYKFSDCSEQKNCKTEHKVTYINEKGETITDYLVSKNCITGEQCMYPTNPSLHKCSFDKISWCNSRGYNQSTSSKLSDGDNCNTPDGIAGNVELCPANDSSGLSYYKCKIKCDQRMKQDIGRSLQPDIRFSSAVDSRGQSWNNAYWIKLEQPKNGFKAGYHLFLRGDFKMPDAGIAYDNEPQGNHVIYANQKKVNNMYMSINGIGALYKLDPQTYSDCKTEYEDTKHNPTLTIPLSYGNGDDGLILSRDFNNINLYFSRKNDKGEYKGWGGKTFMLKRNSIANTQNLKAVTYVWNNIGISQDKYTDTPECHKNDDYETRVSKSRTLVDIYDGVKLKFTGNIDINTPTGKKDGCLYEIQADTDYRKTGPQDLGLFTFRGVKSGYKIIEFNNAKMKSHISYAVYPDIEAYYSNGTVLNIINESVVYTNAVFSAVQVNIDNSHLTTGILNSIGKECLKAEKLSFLADNDEIRRGNHNSCGCRGVAARNNSTIKVRSEVVTVNKNSKMYLDNSHLSSWYPVRLNSNTSVVCLSGTGSLTTYEQSNGSGGYKTTYKTDSETTKSGNTYEDTYTDFAVAMEKYKIGYATNVDTSKRYIYSEGSKSCLPNRLNGGNSKDWKSACKGKTASEDKIDPKTKNLMFDYISYLSPRNFSVRVSKNGNKNVTINGWYPKKKGKSDVLRCDMDAKIPNYEIAKLEMCGNSSSVYDDIAYTDDGFDTHAEDGSAYGKCVNRRFLCSGCSTCQDGLTFVDWSDETGGF